MDLSYGKFYYIFLLIGNLYRGYQFSTQLFTIFRAELGDLPISALGGNL